ncbi:MAG: ABC transporter permease subunit, partial [Clostridiales bacterium]|nr:ABC transporter permease subunit [Clostridiales bacterium]
MGADGGFRQDNTLARRFIRAVTQYKSLYLMLLPGLLFIIIFNYTPMFGLAIAFQDYRIVKGVFGSKFVGLDNFIYLFKSIQFQYALKNTLIISLYKILFGFPIPIILALLLNEVRARFFKKTVQTILYLPHFLSWIIMFGLVFNLVKEYGAVNYIVRMFGGKTIFFLSDTQYFRWIIVISDVWKEMGWNAIIYLAALAAVSQELYEAAVIDGASRVKCMLYIS